MYLFNMLSNVSVNIYTETLVVHFVVHVVEDRINVRRILCVTHNPPYCKQEVLQMSFT